jgi:hypothetical protein
MSQPRYQVFVSSTFKDLQEERQAVLNAILKLNQFPAGMEIFPAANDTPWEMIERIIKDSDYYVLIIGGKYGSIDAESNLSYTEKEYDFAVSQNIPVLSFIHAEPGQIPRDKSEMKLEVQEKLDAFKQKVSKHHCNYWRTVDELRGDVLASLSMAFVMNPQKGWVKSGGIEKNELLERLADLQKRYDELTKVNKNLKKTIAQSDTTQFSQGDDCIHIYFQYQTKLWEINITWNDLLFVLGDLLQVKTDEYYIARELMDFFETLVPVSKQINRDLVSNDIYFSSIIEVNFDAFSRRIVYQDEKLLKVIRNQFVALNFITIHEGTDYKGLSWRFSSKGRKLYSSLNAARRDKIENLQTEN